MTGMSQRGVRQVEGSNEGLNGTCFEACIHSTSTWRAMISRRGDRGRLAHRSGGADCAEERWEARVSQVLPEGNHIAGILDQEQNRSGVSGTVKDSIDSSGRWCHAG